MAERRVGGGGVHIAGDCKFAGQRQVFGVGADRQRPYTGFGAPCVSSRVEVTEGVAIKFDAHGLGFARVKLNLGKALELAGRA